MTNYFVQRLTEVFSNPPIAAKIQEVAAKKAVEISESCKKGIDGVNAHIEKVLTIPDNVILYRDKLFAKEITEQQLKDLQNEVEALKDKMKEVMMIHLY